MAVFRAQILSLIAFTAMFIMIDGVGVFAEESSVIVFDRTPVYFAPDTVVSASDGVSHEDNGRVAIRSVTLSDLGKSVSLTAIVTIHPIPKDEVSVFDPWDRAGDIRLVTDAGIDIELVKFITAYGGRTEYEIDISHLALLLRGQCTFRAFVDTWLNPAWEIDFTIQIETDTSVNAPEWAAPVFFDLSLDRQQADTGGVTGDVFIPDGLNRVKLYYLVSGHCTDGRGADEFEPKDNVLTVDETVVFRYQPWRDDCRDYRDINPYTRRWSDGMWSSDYSRSGWCPGDVVLPLELDLSDHLTSGKHLIRAMIENVRPRDEDDHYGYWRLSAYVVGWKDK